MDESFKYYNKKTECSVFSCFNKKNGPVVMFRFPKEKNIRMKWMNITGMPEHHEREEMFICENHFPPNDVIRTPSKTYLRRGACPLNETIDVDEADSYHSQIDAGSSFSTDSEKIICSEELCEITEKRTFSEMQMNDTISYYEEKCKKIAIEKNKICSNLRMKLHRSEQKVDSLKTMIQQLKSKQLLEGSASYVLEELANDVPSLLFQRYAKNKTMEITSKIDYPIELRKFAMTLNFYSPKAYMYVREKFELALPHPTTISKWYSNVDGSPGFTQQSLNAIARKCKKSAIYVNVVFDEMSLKKGVELVGNTYVGYVDMGLDNLNDDRPLAVEALVVMAVAINDSWKIPIAFFFINGMNSDEKKNIVEQSIEKLYNSGCRVINITCDGLHTNQKMLTLLGADLSLPNPTPYFTHPIISDWKVYVTLDAMHMIKLVRNTLASEEYLLYEDNNKKEKISWKYIEKLHSLQQKENMKLGNKISKKHVQWEKNKMKVALAVQILSRSVADALDCCNKDLKLDDFNSSEGTAEFCRIFDKATDLLNSMSKFGKNHKAPLSTVNECQWRDDFSKINEYILCLKTKNEKSLITSRRKTGFIGIYINLESAKGIFMDLVVPGYLSYLLTYKFSQDHLELWFCAMRMRNGCNPNPTPKQFLNGYRKLIGYTDIKTFGGGNATEQDDTCILDYSTSASIIIVESGTRIPIDVSSSESFNEISEWTDDDNNISDSIDFEDALEYLDLSAFKMNAIGYISGYVVKMTTKILKCEICRAALLAEISDSHPQANHLIQRKMNGRLNVPSKEVVNICLITEHFYLTTNTTIKNWTEKILNKVLSEINFDNIFPQLALHRLEGALFDDHVMRIIKTIASCYLRIKSFQKAKQINEQNSNYSRNHLSRSIRYISK